MNTLPVTIAVLCASSFLMAESAQRRAATRGPRVSTDAVCAAELGAGVSSGRRFCDVIIAETPARSIAIKIPARRGVAKLLFDLHTRVAVPPANSPVEQTFTGSTALVSVVGPKGEIGRGVGTGEFRRAADLFDRIGGGPQGGPKTVAPGPATAIDVTIPAGTTEIGIVGVKLDIMTRLGRQSYDTPGRPIAIASNIRVEYTPLR